MTRPKYVVNPDPESPPRTYPSSPPMKQTSTYRPLPTPVGRVSFIASPSPPHSNVTTPLRTVTESPAAATHKLARKSQSKPNLRSSSSIITLKPKRSAALLKPRPPSEQILSRRAHNSSTHVPINKLPPELLSTIFLILSSSSSPSSSSYLSSSNIVGTNSITTKIPRLVSQVCHFWRCIALNEPLLWARALNLREGPRWIIEVLKRSGDCAIDVVGLCDNRDIYTIGSNIINGHRSSGSHGGRVATGSMLGIILKEVKRIRRLNLTIERKEDWRVVVDCLSRCEVPVLESLTMKSAMMGVALPNLGGLNTNGGGGSSAHAGLINRQGFLNFGEGWEDVMSLPGTLFRGSAPVLKHLSLATISLDAVASFPWLSRLSSLQVTDLEDQHLLSVWEWLSIVRQTPSLEILYLRSVFANEVPPDSPEDAGKVVLKRLKSVELKDTMMECCEFLEKLVVPGECRIHLNTKRANNVHAADKLSEFLRERKMRVENMEGILKTAEESMREASQRRTTLLVHPSANNLSIRVTESICGGFDSDGAADQTTESGEEEEGNCVIKFAFSFGRSDPQSEERHRSIIHIFETLTNALHLVYEDKGGFDSLNISLFGLRDAIKFWEAYLVQFLARLDRVEHLNEVSGYTASVVLPLLVQSTSQHGRRPSSASVTSVSSSLSERYRQNVLLPSLQRITFAFVEFSTNVDDEFEASCDAWSVPDFVRRRYGLGKEVGGISVARQRMLRLQFECCSGPRRMLDELKRLGAEYGLGWACDFDDG